MKKGIIVLSLLIVGFFVVKAQTDKDDIRAKIDNEKIVFFTQKIGLTSDQAPQFWVLYNEYKKNEAAFRQNEQNLVKKGSVDNLTEQQYNQIFTAIVENDRKKADLKEKFYNNIDKILNGKQKILFIQATKEYRSMLLNKLNNSSPQNVNLKKR